MFRAIAITVLSAALLAGCADNETTIYVEHVKTQPTAPDCAYSSGDPVSPAGLLDLSFRNPFTAIYMITNQLSPRENKANFVVESNGVVIEGMEVYVRGVDGSLIGSTEYYEFEVFMGPETSEVAYAVALPTSVVGELANRYACAPLSLGAEYYPPAVLDSGYPAWVNTDIQSVYSEVRFLGHTQGGVDVETPVFTYPIDLCCGCLVDWYACIDPCARYCQEPEPSGMCSNGVANGGDLYDCRSLYYNPTTTWTDTSGSCTNGTVCSCDADCTI